MRHARPAALDRLEPLLDSLRGLEGLVEKRRGVFYRRSRAWVHFHEDALGLHVDARVSGEGFQRFRVEDPDEQVRFLDELKRSLA